MDRLTLTELVSFRVNIELKREVERVARGMNLTTPNAVRLALIEFTRKYGGGSTQGKGGHWEKAPTGTELPDWEPGQD